MPDLGFAAVLTTTGAVVGWAAAYILTGWREDRTKRLQIELDHASAQLKEFYAPLVALTAQLDTTASIKGSVASGMTPEDEHELEVHLLEGRTTPQSFDEYFEHFTTEKAYWTLKKAGKMSLT
jgi:hypothetical protein